MASVYFGGINRIDCQVMPEDVIICSPLLIAVLSNGWLNTICNEEASFTNEYCGFAATLAIGMLLV